MDIKKIALYISLATSLVACQNKGSHEEHQHAKSETEHDHDHDHDHDHEGHEHSADEHSEGTGIEHHHHDEDFAYGDEIIIPAEKARAAGIKVKKIEPKEFNHIINCSGKLVATQGGEATAVAPYSGVVRFDRNRTEGMSVSKGERLLGISVTATSQNDPSREAQIAYELAKKEYERLLPLAEAKIVTASELTNSKQAYEMAKLRYESTNRHGRGGMQSATAPITGYIKAVLVQEGDYVQEGQALMQISQNKELMLRAEVSERNYEQLHQIRSANFKTSYSNSVYQLDSLGGKLLSVGQSAASNSYFVPVTFSFINKSGLRAGSLVDVQLICRPKLNCIVVPRSALTEEEGQYFVYVQLDEEGYKKQKVSLGQNNGKEVEILEGLKAGDYVVSKGAILVKLSSATATIPGHTH